MKRLIFPALAASLLACSGEITPTYPRIGEESLPAIGSTEADAAQDAFLAWFEGVPKALATPIQLQQDLVFEVTLDGSRNEDFHLKVEAEILSDVASLDEMRFDWEGTIFAEGAPFDDLLGQMALQFHLDFLL